MNRGFVAIVVFCAQVLVPTPVRAAKCCDWSKWLSPVGVAGSVVKTDQKAFALGVMLDQPFELRVLGVTVPLAVRFVWDQESIQRETEPGVYLDPPYYYRCRVEEAVGCEYEGQAVEPFTAEAETRKRWYGGLYVMADLSRVRAGIGVLTDHCTVDPESGGGCEQGAGGLTWGPIVSFATAKHSWLTVEFPALDSGRPDEWRVRFELLARALW